MTLAEKLTYAINKRGVSLRALSDVTGIAKSAIQRYAAGDITNVPIYRVEKLAMALNVSAAWLIGWADSEDDYPLMQTEVRSDAALSPTESELVDICRALNQAGQNILINTARGLAANPDLKRDGASNEITA